MAEYLIGENGPEVVVKSRRRYGAFKIPIGASLDVLAAAIKEIAFNLPTGSKIYDLRASRSDDAITLEIQVETP